MKPVLAACGAFLAALSFHPGHAQSDTPETRMDGTLLIANRDGGSISFVDLPTATEMARLPVGPVIPHEVAVSPDGRRALTTEYGPSDRHGQRLLLLDIATASVIGSIDLGEESRPHMALFLPNGQRAVATMQESDELALVDLKARTVIETFPTGGREGHMVKLSPDGRRAYVTSRLGDGTLSVIFLEDERPPHVIVTGPGAEGLAVTPDGTEIWVANRGGETISVIDAETLDIVDTLDARPQSGRIEISEDGIAAVVNGGRGGPIEQYLRLYDIATREMIGEVPLRDGTPQPGHFGIWTEGGYAFVSDPLEGTVTRYALDDLNDQTPLLIHHEAPDGMGWSSLRLDAMGTE